MTEELTLKEFVNRHGQAKVVKMFGITQGGLSRALNNSNRNIIVRIINGQVQAFDIRPFPYKQEIAQEKS